MASLPNPPLPPSQRIDVGEVELAVHLLGDGPPVLLLHGFPELGESLAHQAAALVGAGYSAIVPDQRGYGGSDCPAAVEAYALDRLVGDMVGLLDALGHRRAIVIGHDWGGLVMWRLAQSHADRAAACIGLAAVHWARRSRDPIEALRARYGEHHYIVALQQLGAEAVLDAEPANTADFFYRRRRHRLSDFGTAPPLIANFDLLGELAAGDWHGPSLLAPDERARWIAAFVRTGFAPAANWYRNVTRNSQAAKDLPDRIAVPTLMLSGADDIFSPPEQAVAMDPLFEDLTRQAISGGHWFPQESPAETNAAILAWLATHGD